MGIARFFIRYIAIGIVLGAGFVLFKQYTQNQPAPTPTTSQANTQTNTVVKTVAVSTTPEVTIPSMQPNAFSYASAVNKASPSVVNIYTTKRVATQSSNTIYNRFFRNELNNPDARIETGSGSGVIVSSQGYILTNYHVVKNTQRVHVLLKDGRDFPAKLVGSDVDTDLALLKIEANDLIAVTMASQHSVSIGDIVLAIGNPFGVGQTVTMGIVSATGRDRLGLNTFENFIQTDAAINPGNSGGALVDVYGNLVGINTAIFSKDGGNQGIGFAIPTQMVSNVLDQLITHGQVVRGWIGAVGRDLSPQAKKIFKLQYGAVIQEVVQGSPAYLAGLSQGDIITHIDGNVVKDVQDVLLHIVQKKPGDAMSLKGIRQGKTFETTLLLVQRPNE